LTMTYLFKQKLNLSDLADFSRAGEKILVYEPDAYLADLYRHYLRVHNFDVKHCPDLARISEQISEHRPKLVIFNTDSPGAWLKVKTMLSALIAAFPGLRVVSTAYNINAQGLSELMSLGVSSHINRRLSRPEDLVVIVKNILNH